MELALRRCLFASSMGICTSSWMDVAQAKVPGPGPPEARNQGHCLSVCFWRYKGEQSTRKGSMHQAHASFTWYQCLSFATATWQHERIRWEIMGCECLWHSFNFGIIYYTSKFLILWQLVFQTFNFNNNLRNFDLW